MFRIFSYSRPISCIPASATERPYERNKSQPTEVILNDSGVNLQEHLSHHGDASTFCLGLI
ncbi:hypothetical protein MPB2EB_0911 [Mycoavidus sp. B2-EB]|nr:hypothetical protein MPB2EB_0911 [Mycoavidus sp. B2-EB]